MKISLITTVKDEAHTLPGLIDAVRAQTRAPDEWIVADGGSQDGSASLLREAESCTVLVAPGNIAHGRNTAIARAAGHIIAVTDAGCRPEPQWLARLVAPVEAGSAAVAAGRTRPRIGTPFDAVQWTLLDQFVTARGRWRAPMLSSRSLAFLRSVWTDCPYPEWLDTGEDAWVIARWQERGQAVAIVEDAVVEWALRATPWAFVRQHFRYMQGDGHARMRAGRHALRLAFYATLGALLIASDSAALRVAAAGGWLAYLGATAIRLPPTLRQRTPSFGLRSAAALPVALLAMDVAKISGYLAGTAQRLFAPGRHRLACIGSR